MQSLSHRLNSDFALRYFIAGSCTTFDGAYCLLYSQYVDMEQKVKHSESQILAREISKIDAEDIIKNYNPEYSTNKKEYLEAKKTLLELEISEHTFNENIRGAKNELETIMKLMEEINEHCKYKDEPDILKRQELSMRDEWCGELKKRAENFLITTGTIPTDHFDTMRMHPDFKSKIAPHIISVTKALMRLGPDQTERVLIAEKVEKPELKQLLYKDQNIQNNMENSLPFTQEEK